MTPIPAVLAASLAAAVLLPVLAIAGGSSSGPACSPAPSPPSSPAPSAVGAQPPGSPALCLAPFVGSSDVPATAAIAGPEAPLDAVAWALAQLGSPYSYGGDCSAPRSADPARQCDCSSLVQQAYRAVGVLLPRTTYEQARVGVAVPTVAGLSPGDLIFTAGAHGTRQAPGHVGMYVGNGLLVQAPATGQVVKVTPVQDWLPLIVAIRRVAAGPPQSKAAPGPA